MKNLNYGSCQQNGEDHNSKRQRSPRRSLADIEGEKPHFVAVALSSICLLAAVALFITHVHKNLPPVGLDKAFRGAPLLSSTKNGNAIMASATVSIVPDPNAYPRRRFIFKNAENPPVTIPVLGFPSVALAQYTTPKEQALANEAVRHAVEDLQISYFDVAPEYGDGVAQASHMRIL